MAKSDPADIWSLNYLLLTQVISGATDEVGRLGLEIKEFFVLADIDQCPYPAELAGRLCIPKPTITVYLKSLEKAGFLEREIDKHDLRRHRLVLTAAGRKVAKSAQKILSDAFGARLARLTTGEREELRRILEKLN
jgi:DNA-binding MarR family transcriptional regulator